jgi:NADH-quinone oxidoreductase subunit J
VTVAFYVTAAIAIVATFLAVSRHNAVHALLYLVVSLLSIALIFLLLGAPFVAATEVIIYAGAIMVLFVFVVMMLNMGPKTEGGQRQWLTPSIWIVPAILVATLMAELLYVVDAGPHRNWYMVQVPPREVAVSLLGPYLLGVELASMLLLSALIGAYHLAYHLGGRQASKKGRAAS